MNEEIDRFKPIFKYYKSKVPPPNLDKVIDTNKENIRDVAEELQSLGTLKDHPHLQDSKQWRIFYFKTGLYVINECMKDEGCSYWISRCLKDFSLSKNNLKDIGNWWKNAQSDPKSISKLRWSTLGFHHDWDTKVYSEQGEFPPDLAEFSQSIIGQIPDLCENYQSEAAIINYYPMDSTLSGHVDHSEPNKTAPLVSVSFGQSAIFLIGGPSKSTEPLALLLRHGDILVMTQEARQSFHAVPKILSNPLVSHEDPFIFDYLQCHRINMNIRQVF